VTLQDRTLIELGKLERGSRWTPFEWREYKDDNEMLAEFYETIGRNPEAHSEQFWAMVNRAGSTFFGGGVPFPQNNPGGVSYTLRNSVHNPRTNAMLSADLRTVRPEVLHVKPTRVPCKPLSRLEIAIKPGAAPYDTAVNLYQISESPELILKYACQVPETDYNHRWLVETEEAILKNGGASKAKRDAITTLCSKVSTGDASPDTLVEMKLMK
jgi:hypothetical protein